MARDCIRTDERIATIMSRELVHVDPTTPVSQALDRATRARVEHLVVLADGGESLAGVVCRCDLERARRDAAVGSLVRRPVVTIEPSATPGQAAAVMREKAVGCLPVLAGGLVLGIITRSDLLRAGSSREALGGPCVACGSQHALTPPNGATFCRECLECRGDQGELGGGD